jgi:heavy metal sensor kinase
MRSIRLSLLVYFLGLLGVALAAVSLLVYRTTQQRLAEHKDEAEKLIKAQHDDRIATEVARLNQQLNNDADTLAREAQGRIEARTASQMTLSGFWFAERHNTPEWQWMDGTDRFDKRRPLPPLRGRSLAGFDAMLTAFNPMGSHIVNPFWTAEVGGGAFASVWHDDYRPEIRLGSGDLPLRLVQAEYYQVDSTWNRTYHSDSLGLEATAFPFDAQSFRALPVYKHESDEIELRPGLTVRRVTLNAPFGRPFNWPGRGRFPPPSPGPSRPSSSGRPPDVPAQPAMIIQCGYDTKKINQLLADLEERRKAEIAAVEERNDTTLAELRRHLLITSLATFAAVVLGVYFLVRLGLLPLQRLGDAVSRVSEKDFRLQFDDSHLPSELAPIVDRLKQTLEELRLAFEREKQASADISHELRTPVAALLTTIEVTLKKPRKPEEYREVLADCRESGQQISQLVERLLMLARIDAGVDHLRVENVDVTALAEQCTALVRPLAEARGLKLRLHSEGEAVLAADPAKLREVMTNLLHNAIEYNRPDGSIDLTVGRHNGSLRVEVSDTGVGIAPEARARIFERFYRADPSRHSDAPHSGLGLAIVKGYVDLMGGSIDVESSVGRGSTFRVELPAA